MMPVPSPEVLAALVPVEAPHEIVEMGEDLVRAEVEFGEVARGGAQPAHGGGGVQPMTDDITDDEGDAGAGERDDIEPVAPDSGMRRAYSGRRPRRRPARGSPAGAGCAGAQGPWCVRG